MTDLLMTAGRLCAGPAFAVYIAGIAAVAAHDWWTDRRRAQARARARADHWWDWDTDLVNTAPADQQPDLIRQLAGQRDQ